MKLAFFIRKTLRLVISLFLFSLLLYGLLCLTTGDPAISVLRKLGNQPITEYALIKTRDSLGLGGTFIARYLHWLNQLLKGNFGVSFLSDEPVLKTFLSQSGITFKIIGLSFFINFFLSIILGSIIGNSAYSKKCRSYLTVVLSFPSYWTAIVIIFIFGIKLKWFPFVGSENINYLVLPLIVCFLSEGIYLIKMINDLFSISAQSQQQKIAKLRNINPFTRWSYQLSDNSIALISLYSNSLIHLFGATVMIEVIFSISGIGKLLIDSIATRDYPIIQCISLFIAAIIFLINYFTDLIVLLVDKRITLRQGEK